MNEKLTVREALTKLLSEKKSLLNDGKSLADALKDRVAPEHFMELAQVRRALVEANIGECLFAADGLGREARERAAIDAKERLKRIHLPSKSAALIVEMFTDVLGWSAPDVPAPPPPPVDPPKPGDPPESIDPPKPVAPKKPNFILVAPPQPPPPKPPKSVDPPPPPPEPPKPSPPPPPKPVDPPKPVEPTPPPTTPVKKRILTDKVLSIVAGLALMISVVSFISMNDAFSRLNVVKSEWDNIQPLSERYDDIEKHLGFGSSSFYADKPIVILNAGKTSDNVTIYWAPDRNSEDYDEDDYARVHYPNEIDINWDAPFENHKSEIKVTSNNSKGYYPMHFWNDANDDKFDVLVIVR